MIKYIQYIDYSIHPGNIKLSYEVQDSCLGKMVAIVNYKSAAPPDNPNHIGLLARALFSAYIEKKKNPITQLFNYLIIFSGKSNKAADKIYKMLDFVDRLSKNDKFISLCEKHSYNSNIVIVTLKRWIGMYQYSLGLSSVAVSEYRAQISGGKIPSITEAILTDTLVMSKMKAIRKQQY